MPFGAMLKWLRSALTVYQEKARKAMEGQGLVEYALILVLVAVVVVVVLTLMGPALGNIFSNIVCSVLDVQNAACN